jgi:hypothetical protein
MFRPPFGSLVSGNGAGGIKKGRFFGWLFDESFGKKIRKTR